MCVVLYYIAGCELLPKLPPLCAKCVEQSGLSCSGVGSAKKIAKFLQNDASFFYFFNIFLMLSLVKSEIKRKDFERVLTKHFIPKNSSCEKKCEV